MYLIRMFCCFPNRTWIHFFHLLRICCSHSLNRMSKEITLVRIWLITFNYSHQGWISSSVSLRRPWQCLGRFCRTEYRIRKCWTNQLIHPIWNYEQPYSTSSPTVAVVMIPDLKLLGPSCLWYRWHHLQF